MLKLNGGLGTGMGLEKAKSLLRVRDELTFLDIIARQFLHLRSALAPQLRLILMNSFSTSSDTAAALAGYPELGDPGQLELMQNKVPKIEVKSLAPVELASESISGMVSARARRYLFVALRLRVARTLVERRQRISLCLKFR